jgi:hypothetical protein
MKKLKKFSYYIDHGKNKGSQYYIMASSQKQVVEMLNSIGCHYTLNDVKHYFYKAWGNDGEEAMKDIEITEACIYMIKREGMFSKITETPKKMV